MDQSPSRKPSRAGSIVLLASAAIALAVAVRGGAQELRDSDRTRGRTMLKVIKKELQNRYYDPAFGGMDLDERFQKAETDIVAATSLGHVFGIIAQAVLDLDDSHTRFIPPGRVAKFEYGWRMRMIGDTARVLAVKPGSDAEAKGLKAGDAVLSVDGNALNRQNAKIFSYRYYVVRPAPAMRLVVQSPGGQPRQLDVMTMVDRGQRVVDLTQGEDIWDILRRLENQSDEHRYAESADGSVFLWNIPSFLSEERQIKRIAGKLLKCKSAVIDLRGNSGGYINSLTCLLGLLFDHDVRVGQPKGRDKTWPPIIAKTQGAKAFTGKLVVIVDSDSSSAAELFARVIQLEKRGTVVGDRTSGAVMQARFHSKEMGGETVVMYGISIAEAEVIMGDGQSLEKVGVTPDMIALPSGEDLAAGRDPVLSHALLQLGVLTPAAEAGKLFPYRWAD
jgi:C-terminal processing protease CtpA/Prc